MITGAPETIDGQQHLVLTRTFTAPVQDVWAAITESERLGRWFGTWTGDPASGRVEVSWAYEDEAGSEPYVIEVCEEPTRLRVHNESDDADQVWTLDLRLAEEDGVTTLRFAQVLTDPALVVDVGPGWEYYLDRLTDTVRTGEVATTTWDGYLALGTEYAEAFDLPAAQVGEAVLMSALAQLKELVRAGTDGEAAGMTTPCEGWDVRRLSEHLVTTTDAFTRGVRGEAVDWTASPQPVEGDVAQAFAQAADDLFHARSGAGEGVDPPDWQLAEYAVHTWDLATALGRSTADLDQRVAERGGAFMRANLTDENRGEAFGPARPEPQGGDAYAGLAAFAGRVVD
ncbi:SRPBCC domain-containing protein [Serinicoccus kebangsaanensis]|uniref:SRPBCC domain-containing protein n=1 Tax=Serinicoccus kebangsaanensis TaxID=2602069 RepID=UPI00124E91CE|nr:SRPBCC domain-containing protein [Serinicoccus kebangsaanensis]